LNLLYAYLYNIVKENQLYLIPKVELSVRAVQTGAHGEAYYTGAHGAAPLR
jgi:hypothetical protein